MSNLENDVRALLNGTKAGHMGHWEYSEPSHPDDPVRGSQLWHKFLAENPSYYLPKAEAKIISNSAAEIATFIKPPINFVSLGPGTKENFLIKEIKLATAFEKVESFTVVDVCEKHISSSLEVIMHKKLSASLHIECSDFYQGFSHNNNFTTVAAMFGGTLFNVAGFVNESLPSETVILRLKNLRRFIKNGYLVITQDANQGKERIEAAYRGQTEFALNLIHRINRDTHYEFDIDKCDFDVEWHEQSHVLAHYLIIDGKKYHFNNSYKVPTQDFKYWARTAGFEIEKIYQDNGMNLFLLKSETANK